MRIHWALCVVGACCSLGSGCNLVALTTKNLAFETGRCTESKVESVRDRWRADDAWRAVREADPTHPYSSDYAAGFKDGYKEYLYFGGNGSAPSLPPRCYWEARYQTPEGFMAMEDWFAGFRHGGEVAQSSDLRHWVVLPVSAARADEAGPVLPPPALLTVPAPAEGAVLPPPRPLSTPAPEGNPAGPAQPPPPPAPAREGS